MRNPLPWLALLLVSSAASSPAQTPPDAATEARTRAFLDAYARSDAATVLNAIDQDTVIYGSDVAEIFHGPDGARAMLKLDTQLWQGAATIGPMRDVSTTSSGSITSIFFNADFKLGPRPAVPVRFCMIWKKTGARWMILQSSNTVPTTHQSAAELLAGPAN